MKYLLVTHIPFQRDNEGNVLVDGLWARDLIGLRESIGPIRVVAPELPETSPFDTWGPTATTLERDSGIEFRGFAPLSPRKPWNALRMRAVLREEVRQADVVHSSNLFAPYLGLYYAQELAHRWGKTSVFVVAEDFYDMLAWEWVRPARGLSQVLRQRQLDRLDRLVRRTAARASLTMFHTPAAVARYRLSAGRSAAIRQPGHEMDQVITTTALKERLASLQAGRALELVSACRHASLKGLDLLIRAVALLNDWGTDVRLTLYGKGSETETLKALAAKLGVSSSVAFAGSLPPGEELDRGLRAADVFLMPHRTTDFGRAFFDAMAAALPVVAFRTPASEETVNDNHDGFLVPLDDLQALAEKLAMLSDHRELVAAASHAARLRATRNTRGHWFALRADWIKELVGGEQPGKLASSFALKGAIHGA